MEYRLPISVEYSILSRWVLPVFHNRPQTISPANPGAERPGSGSLHQNASGEHILKQLQHSARSVKHFANF